MREEIHQLVQGLSDPSQKLNRLREYLQAFILRSWHESEAFQSVAFVGGTALRFLHGLPRFSEDLDFSITKPDRYSPTTWLAKLKRDMDFSGFPCEIRWNDRKTVQSGWIRIGGVLKDLGLSPLEDQKISIKVEIDTSPPAGAAWTSSIVTRRLTFVVCHYELPSLMAGKLHALITRPYAKGRDWYDLVWYLSQRPPLQPSLPLLQNALDQTQKIQKHNAQHWPLLLTQKLDRLDSKALLEDVRDFLERPQDAALMTRENLQLLLQPLL